MALDLDVVGMERDALLDATLREVDKLRREGVALKLYRFGFLRLPFTETRTQPGNSLHLWLPDTLPCDEAPHEHNCRIESRILAGTIVNLEWSAPQVDPNGRYRWVQTICTDTVCQDVGTGQNANVDLTGTQTLGPGEAADAYAIPVGQFH